MLKLLHSIRNVPRHLTINSNNTHQTKYESTKWKSKQSTSKWISNVWIIAEKKIYTSKFVCKYSNDMKYFVRNHRRRTMGF